MPDGGLILPGLRVAGGGAREADPLDPLNRGLLGRWTFEDGTGRDSSIWRSHAEPVNGARQGVGRYGKAALLAGPAGTATQNFNAGARQQFAGLQVPLTITARVFQASSAGYQPILAQYRAFPADLIFMLRVDLGDLRYYCRTSGSIQGFGSSFSVPTGQWVFVAAVISGTIAAPSATIYVNRASQSGALSSMASSVDLTVNTRIGSNDHAMIGAGDEGWNGRIEDVGLWGRDLTVPELDRVRDQPFAGTFTAAERLFHAVRLAAPALTHRTLIAEPGAFALTGQAVALRAGRRLTLAAGTFALSGQAVALLAGRRLAAAAGTFSLSGQPVALRAGRRLQLGAGALTVTGEPVALLAGRRMTISPGTLALSGQRVSLLAGRRLALDAGAFVFTGKAVGLTWSGAMPIIAPPSRTYRIPAAPRRHALAAEPRTYRLRAAPRRYTAPPEA